MTNFMSDGVRSGKLCGDGESNYTGIRREVMPQNQHNLMMRNV